MSHRLKIAGSEGPATTISFEAMRPAGSVTCYIFGNCGFDAVRFQSLRPVIERHVGSLYELAAVMHLGSTFQPILLGSEQLFGSAAEQSARLGRFLAEAPSMLWGVRLLVA